MKILQVHNKYQLSGGEDVVLEAEKKLLESYGHKVIQYEKNNSDINKMSFVKKAQLLYKVAWSKESFNEIKSLLIKEKPEICHVHNYLALITPSVFYACKSLQIPVIQTLHNYRMLCSNAYFMRDEKICEACLNKSLYSSVKYGCYRDSKIQTLSLAYMVEKHKRMRTWDKVVDGYICLSRFSMNKFIESGFNGNKIYLKPNFINNDPLLSEKKGDVFLYLGRLEKVKGVGSLFNAARVFDPISLNIAGNGPMLNQLENINLDNINYLGLIDRDEVYYKLNESIALIFPSLLYENMPLSIVEAFACGTPVIASNIGATAEIIEEGKTGLFFEPGNAEDLASKIIWAKEHKDEMKIMGLNARKEFETKYTADRNYEILIQIYNNVINNYQENK